MPLIFLPAGTCRRTPAILTAEAAVVQSVEEVRAWSGRIVRPIAPPWKGGIPPGGIEGSNPSRSAKVPYYGISRHVPRRFPRWEARGISWCHGAGGNPFESGIVQLVCQVSYLNGWVRFPHRDTLRLAPADGARTTCFRAETQQSIGCAPGGRSGTKPEGSSPRVAQSSGRWTSVATVSVLEGCPSGRWCWF